MRVLLVNPPYVGWLNEMRIEPLGLLYIAAWMRQHGHEVTMYDVYIGHTQDELVEIMTKWQPEIVGCTVYTVSEKFCYNLARDVKRLKPAAMMVAGGPHATFCARTMLERCAEIDVVVRHEGELPLQALVQALEAGTGFETISGITFRVDGRIIENPPGKPVEQLDSLPWPAKDLLSSQYSLKATPLITSRGCPHKCTYCVSPRLFGGVRLRSILCVAREIQHCQETYGTKHIRFYDDIFALNLKRMQSVAKHIGPLGVTWDCNIRVEHCDPEMLAIMRAAGCVRITFGVETGGVEARVLLKGGQPTDQLYRTIVLECRQLGIETYATYVLGFPEEKRKDILRTIDFADNLDTDRVGFYKLTPYPGTVYFELIPTTLVGDDSYTKHHIEVSVCKSLSSDELDELLHLGYQHFYKEREFPMDPDAAKFLRK